MIRLFCTEASTITTTTTSTTAATATATERWIYENWIQWMQASVSCHSTNIYYLYDRGIFSLLKKRRVANSLWEKQLKYKAHGITLQRIDAAFCTYSPLLRESACWRSLQMSSSGTSQAKCMCARQLTIRMHGVQDHRKHNFRWKLLPILRSPWLPFFICPFLSVFSVFHAISFSFSLFLPFFPFPSSPP